MALLSVVIPTYDRVHCLPRAIDSALAQTYCEIEVIVVDDGSTDDTAQVMADRYGNEPRVRYVRQDNSGVAAARNTGIRCARGEYLALLDSDDYWQPWKSELQLRCLEALPDAGMVWTDMAAVETSGRVVDPFFLKQMYSAYGDIPEGSLFSAMRSVVSIWPGAPAACSKASISSGDIYSSMILGNLVHTSTVVLRRDRLEKAGYFREDFRYGEDYDFHLRTCREGSVAFIDVSSIDYQVGMPDQLTRLGLGALLAQNFLKTILPAIERDRDRIKMSQQAIDKLVADAYAWLGDELLQANLPGAHRAFWSSLEIRQRPRTAFCLAVALLPVGLRAALRAAFRSAKQTLRLLHLLPRREFA